ncbi:MAG: hypothetical protein ACXWLM_01690, partial [Myxococcales bacterium]
TNPEHEVKRVPRSYQHPVGFQDPLVQNTSAITLLAPTVSLSFAGVGQGFTGPSGSFSVTGAPPDTNGDVGPNHYVQTVNQDLMIWNKTGGQLHGPLPINSLFQSLGGLCAADNDGDPVVLYDRAADRWFISQFAVTNPNPNYHQCVAVSQTSDPTGSYWTYDFPYTAFNDYGKAGVWGDAYYWTYNMFTGGTTFAGAKICAMDRTRMLAGQAATQQCFSTSTSYGGLLPADIDGAAQPASGEPEFVVGMGTDTTHLGLWKFHVDWTTPANSTFSGPTLITVPAFAEACSGATCVPQTGTTQQLDSLADRMMYRLQWRKTSDGVEHLITNHSVTAGSSTGVRWYEIRSPNGTPTLFQSGTYAPDSAYRWMGSAAMDGSGGIGLGFSISSSSTHPGIAVTGRNSGDAAGTMAQGETAVLTGGGSQTTNLSRWGDYSNLVVDPADDCTFWYTTEYIPANGTFNWHTQVATFKLSGCGATASNDFSIGASPTTVAATQGGSGSTTITTATTSGSAQSVSFSASGLPSGATASFSPASVTAGGSSTLTMATGSSTAAGTYTVTVTGAGSSATHSASVSLTVTAPSTGGLTNGNFEAGSLSGWTATGASESVVASGCHGGTYCARLGSTSPTSGDSTIAQTFTAPSGATSLSLWYKETCPDTITYDWALATLVDNTAGTSATVVTKACVTNAWTQASAAVAAGHSYTLTLTSHDDNWSTDPTFTLFDDVAFGSSPPPTGGITNGGFEAGSFTGWTRSGSTAITTVSHSGSYAALAGNTVATAGDSSLVQSFTVPAGATTLSLYYANNCPDTVTYDWVTITLKDTTAGTTRTLVPKTCATSYVWTNVTASVTAGHAYTLTLTSHDDNWSTDPTYTLFDDVLLR